ncbi:hypothetical protein FOA52_006859 [Chlamydomonas sp. UWO 241]|nr:hypothetical protein FOA52_006859 [Chlamydomonas sp. UWO 241]
MVWGHWILRTPRVHNRIYEAEASYGHQQWKEYRNVNFRYRAQPVLTAGVIAGFWQQLVLVAIVSVLSCSYFQWLVPLGAPGVNADFGSLFTVNSLAMVFLITFKINQSYARYAEGRLQWGVSMGIMRNILRLMFLWSDKSTRHLAEAAARWAPAVMWLQQEHLREGGDERWRTHMEGLLSKAEIAYLEAVPHRTLAASHMLSYLANSLQVSDYKTVVIQSLINDYGIQCAGNERIFRTPLPTGYSRFMARAVCIYCYSMPVLLWPLVGWTSPAVSCVLSFIFFGIENVAVQIEEPFRALDLQALCKVVAAAAQQMSDEASSCASIVTALGLKGHSGSGDRGGGAAGWGDGGPGGGGGGGGAAGCGGGGPGSGGGGRSVDVPLDEYRDGPNAANGRGAAAGTSSSSGGSVGGGLGGGQGAFGGGVPVGGGLGGFGGDVPVGGGPGGAPDGGGGGGGGLRVGGAGAAWGGGCDADGPGEEGHVAIEVGAGRRG